MEKVNVLVLLVIFVFLLSYFEPELILEDTTITGGDTASHYAYAKYMKDNLLPQGKFSGWYPGAYAGFPAFVFYFFPPFMLAALMGYVIPLTVAFKIVTILGIISLPSAVFIAMRLMRFRFPMPIIAAVFTLPFLFIESNSVWGGNILSTLAGEFSYGISLSLAVVFMGILYRRIESKNHYKTLAPVLLLVLVVLTHVYTTIFVVLCSSFFLLTRNRERFSGNFAFLFWVYLTSFLLVSFWAIPLAANLGYTTPYPLTWNIKDLKEVFPVILYPFYVFAIPGLYLALRGSERRILFIAYSILAALALYLLAPKMGIVDIRFLPFVQLFILFISAYGFVGAAKRFKGQRILLLIVLVSTLLWVNGNVTKAPLWIEWNYEGFENKPLWGAYSGVNEFLEGGVGDPRVVYEHSPLHNSAGSTRAFESLPLFSGRSTLEGLYMQSSITAPYVFLIQSEISKVASCPFAQWPCGKLNSTAAAGHMEAFNVGQVVAVSKEVKDALKSDANYKLAASFPPYEVYDLVINKNRYVVVPGYEPVQLETEHYKEDFYLWFMRNGDVPLVFDPDNSLELKAKSLDDVPAVAVENNCSVREVMENEEIRITTNCVGKPHIIKVSYFPNWKVEGASRIYLVSPSFMLIYPEEENVRVYYGRTIADYLGLFLSLIGVLLVLVEGRVRMRADRFIKANSRRVLAGFVIAIAAFSVVSLASHDDAYRDSFAFESSITLKNYALCDEIKSDATRELCFKEVGIATNDYNLCDVKIEDPQLRDMCFKEIRHRYP